MIKRQFILATAVLAIVACTAVKAQDQPPMNSHQRYWQSHRSELKLEKNSIEVSPGDLPQKLQHTLEKSDLYKGWQDSPLYFDKDSDLYTLYIKKDSTINVYGFNDKGRAVTYDSYTVHEE